MKKSSVCKFVILLIFVIFTLANCNPTGTRTPQNNNAPLNPPITPTPPTVIITPNSGATGVSLTPTITLLFNEKVNNVNSSTITMSDSKGSPVGIGAINNTANSNIYTFSPSNILNTNTVFSVALSNGISNDANTATLVATKFSFTTQTVDPNAPPTVSMPTPGDKATGVSLTPSFQIVFNQAVNNVNPSNIILSSSNGIPITIDATTIKSNDQITYTFSASVGLSGSTLYNITFTSGITSKVGGKALNKTSFSFTTQSSGPSPAPEVQMTTPTSSGASLLPLMTLVFTEVVKNVTPGNVTLNDAAGNLITIGTISSTDQETYTFSPSSQLNPNIIYSVTLNSGITSTDNIPLVAIKFSFTTGSTILSITPDPSNVSTSLNWSNPSAKFIIKNTSTSPVTLTSIADNVSPDQYFSTTYDCSTGTSTPLAAGSSCTVTVNFLNDKTHLDGATYPYQFTVKYIDSLNNNLSQTLTPAMNGNDPQNFDPGSSGLIWLNPNSPIPPNPTTIAKNFYGMWATSGYGALSTGSSTTDMHNSRIIIIISSALQFDQICIVQDYGGTPDNKGTQLFLPLYFTSSNADTLNIASTTTNYFALKLVTYNGGASTAFSNFLQSNITYKYNAISFFGMDLFPINNGDDDYFFCAPNAPDY